ncbi:MAG: hypothetical protein JO264_10420 [Acidisphaera sp.]|nr:hypothetical protein [Acidisphaera sp.]
MQGRLTSILFALCLQASGLQAQTQAQLNDTVALGSLAALAPICGLRDERWAVDLRRAAIQAATRSHAHDDAGLKAMPGSNLAVGALSFAETEALESFAEAPAVDTCEPLARNPDLRRADAMVLEFRRQRGVIGSGS